MGGALCALLVLTGLTVAPAAPAHAAPVEFTDPTTGISFSADSSHKAAGAEVTDYSSQNVFAQIPGSVTITGELYAVTRIGEDAFRDGQLELVEIPPTVTEIKSGAFASNNLQAVAIPGSVVSIGDYAFLGNELTNLMIAPGVTTMGSSAFGSNHLTDVVIPDSVTSIGESAFSANVLTSISLPAGLTEIGDFALSGNNFTTLELPAGLVFIGNGLLHHNELTEIVIPAGVTSIGQHAFKANQLTSVVIPQGVTSIGNFVFDENYELAEVTFEGNAPSTFFAVSGSSGSLGTNPVTLVRFNAGAKGFSTPTWKGYASQSNGTPGPTPDPQPEPKPDPAPKPFPYKDVAKGSTFYTPINWMFQKKFAAEAPMFNPTGSTTRGAMATMLMRIKEAETGKKYTPSASLKLPFKDVTKKDTHYRGIAWLWENGLAARADKFNASSAMTRGAMATFLYRMEGRGKDKVTFKGTYTDVSSNNKHATGIERMAAKKYAVSGKNAPTYRPQADVTRQAMATMLYRLYK